MSASRGRAWIVFDYDEALTLSRSLFTYEAAVDQCGCKTCEVQQVRVGALMSQLHIFFECVSKHPEYFTGGFHEASATGHPPVPEEVRPIQEHGDRNDLD